MRVSHAVTNQFEAELDEGDHKTLRLRGGGRSGVLQSHAGLAEGGGAFLDDAEEFHGEDRLGCARGVLWALLFEAALVAAGAICWNLWLTR